MAAGGGVEEPTRRMAEREEAAVNHLRLRIGRRGRQPVALAATSGERKGWEKRM